MSSAVGGSGRLFGSDVLAVSEVLSAVTQLISIGLTRRETGRSRIGPRERGIQFRGLAGRYSVWTASRFYQRGGVPGRVQTDKT